MNMKQFSESGYMRVLLLMLFSGSLLLHILIVMRIYRPGFELVLTLTGGMVLAWLYASQRVKTLSDAFPGENPWRVVFRESPDIWKFGFGFLTLYAVINLFLSLSADTGSGYINTTIPFRKLRGISGFWILFFALATLAQLNVKRLLSASDNPSEGPAQHG
jgi:hypothetical protein